MGFVCEIERSPVTVTEEGYAGTLDSDDFGTPLKVGGWVYFW